MSNSKPHSPSDAAAAGEANQRFRSEQKSRPGLFKRTPRDFLDMFLERWWIGAIAGAIAATLIIVFRPHFEPLYRTQASLLFETRKSSVVPMQGVVETTLQGPGELNVHIEELRSNTFAAYVLSSFTPEQIKTIQQPYIDPLHPETPPPSLAEIVRPGVFIAPRRTSPILDISVTHRSPEAARLIADHYAQKFMDYRADNASTRTTTAILWLQNQVEELRLQVDQAQNQLLEYRQKNNLTSLSENQNIISQKLNSLSGLLVKAQVEQVEAKNLIDRIAEYRSSNRDLLELPQIVGSGGVSGFAKGLSDLRSQRILWSEEYGAEHPRMKQLDLQIAESERRLNESFDKAIADLQARFDQADKLVKKLIEERAASEAEARKLDKISTDYQILASSAAETAKQYGIVSGRLADVKVATQLQDANVTFLDHAWTPSAPADTGIAAVSMKAASAGFGLLFFIPLAFGLFDTRIRTPMHVEEGLQEPLLGAVKRMRKMGETQRAQVFRLQKEKDLAEAYLGIFSEVEVRSALGFPKTMLITSSVPAEGKSLLCSNLAAVFASHKRRTLLVDCDLRRPTLHRYFGVKVDTGWVQWLEAPAASRPVTPLGIVAVSDDLHLLPAGRAPGNPTELLDRLSRRETLQPLLQNYDIVIFDTPPAAVFPDALLLARSCHEMIYVCRYRTVRLSVVRKVLERFRDSGVSTLGIVLNQLPEAKARSYGYHGYGMQSADYYKAYAEKPEA